MDNPRESLAVELKDWFEPGTPEGQAKIVRACIAMRNRNGGYVFIGFDNNTAQPNVGGYAGDVRADFHADEINKLVNGYASDKFEVHVHFAVRDDQDFPVLEVDAGVKTPVASKSDLFDPNTKSLVRANAIYVRTLLSNNTPSTGEARWNDWAILVEICFDNREADVGRFLRRRLDRRQLQELGRKTADVLGACPYPAHLQR